jgi:lipopolysaccharide/colanic/teichoic acid biosynthesis glycosyltransferase
MAGCTIPERIVVRDRVWTGSAVETEARQPLSYQDRLARLSLVPKAVAQEDKTSHQPHARVKRAFDAFVAAVSLMILFPVLLIVAILIWLESGRPLFYAQRREGLGGRVFRCWKFRTMSINADQSWKDLKAIDTMDGPHFKLAHDPRVTRVGRVLRALNIDELPQFINVLLGDMSLVGPRPSPFRENQVCVPWREARLSVRPGITGLWQVCRHDRSSGDFHQWIEYDLMYVQHGSLWLDLRILLATVITLGGKRHVRSSWLIRPRLGDYRSATTAAIDRDQPVPSRRQVATS